LAFDLGAGSGRAFLGALNSGILTIQEIHRFANEPIRIGSATHWDAAKIWGEIRRAFTEAESFCGRLAGVGVDTWGVDYALLGDRGELLQNPLHYRDPRNVSAMNAVLERISKEDIYRRTGVQFMPINTLYQLFAAKRDSPEVLSAARTMVLMADLFRYWLSGDISCEYTNASTTQFADPVRRNWDRHLFEQLDLPPNLPAEIVEPGSVVGRVLSEVSPKFCGTPVIAPGSHDTASAVAAITARDGTAFLSSGTWSLLGIEVDQPVISEDALRLNFTNEGGVRGTTRLLKNVMGLWLLEECRRSWGADTYYDLIQAASSGPPFAHLVDPDHASFLNPPDMTISIHQFCKGTGQLAPSGSGAYVRAILESLALKYRLVVRSLEALTSRTIASIRIIGGGSRNRVLNQFTADATGATVIAGPIEATVLGNLGMQMLATGEVGSLAEMRKIIDRSFPVEMFTPNDPEPWNRQAQRFRQYCENSYA